MQTEPIELVTVYNAAIEREIVKAQQRTPTACACAVAIPSYERPGNRSRAGAPSLRSRILARFADGEVFTAQKAQAALRMKVAQVRDAIQSLKQEQKVMVVSNCLPKKYQVAGTRRASVGTSRKVRLGDTDSEDLRDSPGRDRQ